MYFLAYVEQQLIQTLNPIEQAFAKIKHWMRMAQKRDMEDAWRHVGHLAATFTEQERRNYFINVEYASDKK